jgi:hypothetical protein
MSALGSQVRPTVTSRKPLLYSEAVREDRCGPRTVLSIKATLIYRGLHLHVTITDLSIAGFSVHTNYDLETGSRCWLRLPKIMPLSAVIERQESSTFGCSFNRLFDPTIFNQVLGGVQAAQIAR